MRLRGRTWVLVGASSGIGRALARRLASEGVTLRLTARRGEELAALAEEIRAAGGAATWRAADARDPAEVRAAWEAFRAEGAVDGLLYMAGVSHVSFPPELSAAEARAGFEPNFFGFLHWLELVLPELRARGEGMVGACSALCAYRGIPTGEVYAASKAALKAYLEALRIDLKPYGVEVVQLMPGFVESPMSALNNFTQPFMIPAEEACDQIVAGLRAGRARVEFGRGMSWLMRLLRVLPDPLYEALFAGFAAQRYAAEETLAALPPFLCPETGEPLVFDRYGAFRHPESGSWVRFWRDRLDVLEASDTLLDEAHEKVTAAYRIYAVTYPVTAFLAMTFVWSGRLGPLVEHYAQTLRAAGEAPLLDVATGDGALLKLAWRAAERSPPLLSVDLSPDMVRKAARRLRAYPRKLFYVHDVGTLNLPAGSFEHVACYGGFHVFPDPEGALASMARVLAPGGTLSGSILTRPPGEWARWWSDRFIDWGQLSNSCGEAEIEGVFAAAGLELTERAWNGSMLLFRARRR